MLNFVQSQLIENKSYDTYLASIRANIRGLYRDQLSLFQFVDGMVVSIERHLNQAWNSGAADCGFKPNEFSQADIAVRDNYINNQLRYIIGLGSDIQLDRNNIRIGNALQRALAWANRWYELYNLAKVTLCADAKFIWRIGEAEHCVTCLKLNGRVMRASKWQEVDIWPRDTRQGKLDCHGFNCQCRLERTSLPVTRGPFPQLR